jgi:16S rRNA (guanine527-N7)-methyltransferase
MFHVEHADGTFEALEDWLGVTLGEHQREQLLAFEDWLRVEALVAGGIGPHEKDRLFDRHVADSLAFLTGYPQAAQRVVDVGGGIGLPSIPLAIARPDTELMLVDRSQRRTDLARRAARILGLENYSVLTGDASMIEPVHDIALFRASLPVTDAAAILPSCITPGGVGLFAVSRRSERPSLPSAPVGITFALSREGEGTLSSPFWLLAMHVR